jgi:hypothetical protein
MSERTDQHPDINDKWVVAARTLDAEYEKEGGIKPVAEKHGIDYEVMLFVAEQRALRAVLAGSNRADVVRKRAKAAERGDLQGDPMMAISLSGPELKTQDVLTHLNMETMMIGWRALQIKPGEYPEWTGPGSDIRI